MSGAVPSTEKLVGSVVEYLDEGKLRPALVIREQGNRTAVLDAKGHEKVINRDLVLLRHQGRRAEPSQVSSSDSRAGGRARRSSPRNSI